MERESVGLKDLAPDIKKEFYNTVCEGEPNAFYILSGGIAPFELPDGKTHYRSGSYADLDPHGLASGGKARVVAAAELSNYFSSAQIVTNSHYEIDRPSHAQVAARELVGYGVPKNRIVQHPESNSTFTELSDLLKMIDANKWNHVVVVTNEFQVPRASEMLQQILEGGPVPVKETMFTQALQALRNENIDMLERIQKNACIITFVAAEKVLPYRDSRYATLIAEAQKTEAYQKRVAVERGAVEQLRAGTYGRKIE